MTRPSSALASSKIPPWKWPCHSKGLHRKQVSRLSSLDAHPLNKTVSASGVVKGAPLWKGLRRNALGSALGPSASIMSNSRRRSLGKISAAEAIKAGSIKRLRKLEMGKVKAGGTSSGETSPGESRSGEQNPGGSPEPPLSPDVSLRLSVGTVTLAAFALGLFALSCSVLPPLRIANLPLLEAILLHILLSSNAIFLEWTALQSFKNGSASMTGRLRTRHPGLPPDRHTLSDPRANRVCFYNSVSKVVQWEPPPSFLLTTPEASPGLFGTLTLFFQQLWGLLQPIVTVGLYLSTVVTVYWFSRGLYRDQLGVGTTLSLLAAFLALPQPLPFVVLALSSRPSFLGEVVAAQVRLDYARVALLPLPYSVPLPVPVPRWELLTSSWRALLYAAPMVLTLARLLAAAAAANPQVYAPSKLYTLVLCSRPVQISACVSAVAFLLGRQRAAYEVALEEKKKEEEAEVDTLDKKLLESFDRMLVDT
ncbi:hypothetical protein KFL_000100570 [Klebsormidium nitens]|uniref:WW domain-containing protein n=1 Tax=Klebsormidium nitens TaxID=105231 RepID=A0A1Y1HKY0_KLENI|nr:hypothetical protein KFL_000100570 [Klebsormidium nitens]|eukprot:GAQ78292.1 hypothetical protein KFL_000100570 [Klebsormidium nitens]